jgi:tRNA U34 2-thiouridine synthase MnmA/TrmU
MSSYALSTKKKNQLEKLFDYDPLENTSLRTLANKKHFIYNSCKNEIL